MGRGPFIPQYDRAQYELLLTVADVAAVRASLEAKSEHATPSPPGNNLHGRFARRAEELVQLLADPCAALGLGPEYRAIVVEAAPFRRARRD